MPKGKVEVGTIRVSPGKQLGSLHLLHCLQTLWDREERPSGVKPWRKPTESSSARLDEVFSLTSVSSVVSVKCQSAA